MPGGQAEPIRLLAACDRLKLAEPGVQFCEPHTSVNNSTVIAPDGLMRNTSRSAANVWVILRPTTSMLPMVMLSGIVRVDVVTVPALGRCLSHRPCRSLSP